MSEPELCAAAVADPATQHHAPAQLQARRCPALRPTCSPAQDGRLGSVHVFTSAHYVPCLQLRSV
jgi:hypothetical protein